MNRSKQRLVIVYSGLFIFYAFLLLPIVWLVLSSFRNTDSIQSGRLLPYASEITVTNYVEAFRIANLTTFLVNSFIIAITVMLLVVFIASLGAYALSRFNLRGKNVFMMLALMPQFFPYVLILIPFYVLMTNIGLVDSHLGLILTHTSITLPFALWMLTGYFQAIPRDLDQAALIDGCSRLGVLFRIIYPIAIPGMVVAGFFAFVVSWGDYLFVSILSQSPETQTLPIGLQTFMSSLQVRWGLITAGTVIAIVPTIVFFAIVQRRLVAGLTAGAVK
ncbi:MAG: carbohydrate ABC transporter permease [Terrimicrobium sp.]|jgi:ABC-type glycerol-3-phosphate transport system permease component